VNIEAFHSRLFISCRERTGCLVCWSVA